MKFIARTLHTAHKTAENAIILHTYYKLFSQLQQPFQKFFGQRFSQLFSKFCAALRVVLGPLHATTENATIFF